MTTTAMQAAIDLGGVVENARDALRHAKQAATNLDGSRAARANELVDMLADVLTFAERLEFVAEGDARAV